MGKRDPRVDAYIAKAPEFAKPILRTSVTSCTTPAPRRRGFEVEHAVVHVQGHPVRDGRVQAARDIRFLEARSGDGVPRVEGSMGFGRLTKVSDLPPKKALAAYVKKAAALNDAGIKPVRTPMRGKPKPPAKAPRTWSPR
jgi:hypothetical protein